MGISQPAIFDCQRVSTNIPFTLLIFHENFNTSPFYYDFTEKRIYSHLQKYIQEKTIQIVGNDVLQFCLGIAGITLRIYIYYIYIIYIYYVYVYESL
jgi:hypothetical protein